MSESLEPEVRWLVGVGIKPESCGRALSTANYCAVSPAPSLTFFKSEFLLLSESFFWWFTWQRVLICVCSVDTAALWCYMTFCWNPHLLTLSVSGSYWNWVVTGVLWHRHIREKRRELSPEWMVALRLHRCTWPPRISESSEKLHVISGQLEFGFWAGLHCGLLAWEGWWCLIIALSRVCSLLWHLGGLVLYIIYVIGSWCLTNINIYDYNYIVYIFNQYIIYNYLSANPLNTIKMVKRWPSVMVSKQDWNLIIADTAPLWRCQIEMTFWAISDQMRDRDIVDIWGLL